ncbi:MAG: hypothetical protein KKD28_14225 [Chloroflexi bacterium]|nr:hypothetical protein [Chloroflexota bacterium]
MPPRRPQPLRYSATVRCQSSSADSSYSPQTFQVFGNLEGLNGIADSPTQTVTPPLIRYSPLPVVIR